MAVVKRKKKCGKAGIRKENPEIRDLLSVLYPAESISRKYREYQMKKRILVAVLFLIGTGAFICMQVGSRMHNRLKEGTHLSRNEWGEGSYFVTLQAQTASGDGEITYQVEERVFTEKELEALLSGARERLLQYILGENESLENVSENLNLVSELKGYPFAIRWKSSDLEKIRTDGTVNTEAVSEAGEEMILTAVFSYEEEVWEQEIRVRLVPIRLSDKEKFLQSMRTLLSENDRIFAESKEIVLPEKLEGETVTWKEKKADNSLWIPAFCMAAAFFCGSAMDRELRKKNQERKEEIIRSYPEFVSRLRLYMGAGLSIKNALLRIGKDYKQEKTKTGKTKYLYEELLILDYQLMNGKSENTVYREWGRRCDVMCCRKLGFLLTSALRQGNERILSMLDKEACFAWEERKSRARKQGEEAGTKLLFPMLLMLLIVMFLILLPAFTGLQGM